MCEGAGTKEPSYIRRLNKQVKILMMEVTYYQKGC